MAINQKIWDFPALRIESQLFHVPGAFFDGGLTSGGARIMSPEPGGRSVLETKIAFQVTEWDAPFSSWLMSKINGEIFRVPLIKTPQLASFSGEQNYSLSTNNFVNWDNSQTWDNNNGWSSDGAYLNTTVAALEGSTKLYIDTLSFGQFLKHGHVIGYDDVTHIIDDIEYNNSIAEITVKPPLRKNIDVDDLIQLQPYFLGTIANGSEIRTSYQASNLGAIQLGEIRFNEAII